jgi:hypothetical protein
MEKVGDIGLLVCESRQRVDARNEVTGVQRQAKMIPMAVRCLTVAH